MIRTQPLKILRESHTPANKSLEPSVRHAILECIIQKYLTLFDEDCWEKKIINSLFFRFYRTEAKKKKTVQGNIDVEELALSNVAP